MIQEFTIGQGSSPLQTRIFIAPSRLRTPIHELFPQWILIPAAGPVPFMKLTKPVLALVNLSSSAFFCKNHE
jgi:hypothetical protein